MDATIQIPILTEKTVAFLSPVQAEAYGGVALACEILKVDHLCEPEYLLDHTIGIFPWFGEVGHG